MIFLISLMFGFFFGPCLDLRSRNGSRNRSLLPTHSFPIFFPHVSGHSFLAWYWSLFYLSVCDFAETGSPSSTGSQRPSYSRCEYSISMSAIVFHRFFLECSRHPQGSGMADLRRVGSKMGFVLILTSSSSEYSDVLSFFV